MKVAVLGTGTWGFTMAALLASKGYQVIGWSRQAALVDHLNRTGTHPKLPENQLDGTLHFTKEIDEALSGCELLVEAVTSKGIRPVFEHIASKLGPDYPIVVTSKGIEQDTGLILPEVIAEVLGESHRTRIAAISGPGYAQEVVQKLPTSVVGAAFSQETRHIVCDYFNSDSFRVYPNGDLRGVCFGAALKNCIAIACGMSDGLGLGVSAKAALMTRGLHEMCKLGLAMGCKAETFYGLSGMGDVFLTCSSPMSRNYRFGHLLAQGLMPIQAQEEIGMVVEGAYTAISALQLSQKHDISMPITQNVVQIISGELTAQESVRRLMSRTVKEEHL